MISNDIFFSLNNNLDDGASRSSQKKKKKDRDRDKERSKDKSHKHKSHSSSTKSSSSHNSKPSTITSNGSLTKSKSDQNSSKRTISSGSSHEKSSKADKIKSSHSSSTTKTITKLDSNNTFSQSKPCGSDDKQIITNESASKVNNEIEEIQSDKCKDLDESNVDINIDETSVNSLSSSSNLENKTSDSPSNLVNSIDDMNNIPDTTTTDIESNVNRLSPVNTATQSIESTKSERKVFVPSNLNANAAERKPTEIAGIVIKKDYLPSPTKQIKVEKTREDVTRVLSYDTEPTKIRSDNAVSNDIISKDSNENDATTENIVEISNIKTEPIDSTASISKISDETLDKKSIQNSHISDNKENSTHKIDTPKKIKSENSFDGSVKVECKSRDKSDEKKDSNSKSSSKEYNSQQPRHHSSKSSSLKSSSHRSGSSSSNKDCSRCYRRSKIKRTNVGIQCSRHGEPFKCMTPTSTPLKSSKTLASNMTDNSIYSDLKYGRFFHIEKHTNGGASIVHMYQNEINSLNECEMDELTEEFFRVVFSENEEGFAYHVMGIVHDAASYIPDLLEHFSDNYSTLTVKAGVLGRNSDIETSTMAQYYEQIAKNYSHGTFRYGPLHQISLVGKVHEEVGGYFPDLLGRLESNSFLKKVNKTKKFLKEDVLKSRFSCFYL